MITYNKEKLNIANNWLDDTIRILIDFDRTITVGNSESSWGVLSKSNLVPKEYVKERQALYSYYRPFEIDEKLDYDTKNKLMIEWWNKHINLLIKYRLSESIINETAKNLTVMSFRDGAEEFFKNMNDRNIPVIIISAGIGNFIEQFLIKNDCYFDNIYIISNFIKFENGIAVGVCENVIHSLNKNEVALPQNIKDLIKDRTNIILLGDSISDIKMAREEDRESALKIGFLDENIEENKPYFEKSFDIVCTDNTTYTELFNKVHVLKR